MNSLKGKIILITGATTGIGEASAKRCAEAGGFVIVSGRNKNHGEKVVNEIIKNGGSALFLQMDINTEESINAAYAFLMDENIYIDILINNAGAYFCDLEFEKMASCFNNEIISTNLEGTIMVTKKFLPIIRQRKGSILFTSSVGGLDVYTNGGGYLYSACKAGVIKFAKLLAKNYGSEIRVNIVCPGVIKTSFYTNFNEQKYIERIPMGRVGIPEDIAKVINFLVSDDAEYINGSVLTVDGGLSL